MVSSCSSCRISQHKRLAHAAHAEKLSIRGQPTELMPKELSKEVNSCRRAQHKRSAHETHVKDINTAHAEELSYSSCRRAQHCSLQESSATTHAEELSTAHVDDELKSHLFLVHFSVCFPFKNE